jgi:hypothetical protein
MTNAVTDFITGLENAELPLIEGPIMQGLTTLTQPNANFLTVLDAGKNLQLQALQLNLPAQTALINYVSSFLIVKLQTLIAAQKAATAAPAA